MILALSYFSALVAELQECGFEAEGTCGFSDCYTYVASSALSTNELYQENRADLTMWGHRYKNFRFTNTRTLNIVETRLFSLMESLLNKPLADRAFPPGRTTPPL
jgi:hypothetical protein